MPVQLDAIGIVVRDMTEALRFYRMLDLDVSPESAGEDHVEASTASGLRIMWDTVALVRQIDPEWTEPTGHRIGLAFKCDSPAEVDARYAEILAAGFQGHREPWDAFWGQRYATVLDPDGNAVDLFAPL